MPDHETIARDQLNKSFSAKLGRGQLCTTHLPYSIRPHPELSFFDIDLVWLAISTHHPSEVFVANYSHFLNQVPSCHGHLLRMRKAFWSSKKYTCGRFCIASRYVDAFQDQSKAFPTQRNIPAGVSTSPAATCVFLLPPARQINAIDIEPSPKACGCSVYFIVKSCVVKAGNSSSSTLE